MANHLLTCPDCHNTLRPSRNPYRGPVIVSCQCGAQLLARPHPRRVRRLSCTVLRTDDEKLAAWDLVRAAAVEPKQK